MSIMDPTQLLLSGAYEPLQLFLVVSLALVCITCLAWMLVSSTHKPKTWWHSKVLPETGTNSRAGLNAAEKGTSSVAIRAERIPYDLEKRAIVHRRWAMIGHASQFPKPGDYRTYTVADIPLLVIQGQNGEGTSLRAFHNVCRHRAHAVARKPCGSSLRLACKYHGWQYDTAGQLVKAPEFVDDKAGGFDFAANGLFRIHLRIDSGGFVFVNLATELADAFPWTDISSPALRTLDFGGGGGVGTLLPWFLDGTRFLHYRWSKKALTYLWSAHRLHLQYVDDASFICDLGAGDFLLISALPLTAHKSLAKCTYLPPHRPNSTTTTTTTPTSATISPNKDDNDVNIENIVRTELAAAVAALKRHRMASPTALDFQQSAVRERLDKFSRHVHSHGRAETLAGRKINPALRRPTNTSGTNTNATTSPSSSSSLHIAGSRTAATTAGGSGSNNNCPIDGSGKISAAPRGESSQQQQQSLGVGVGVGVDADAEAEAICNALDGLGDGATTSGCLLLERSTELEW
ncbi:iron-sulfur cluster-binding protein [Apiospora phragmitis]|uniref:Iron-sulfur cluster-binding protein n=1 Tax=Apiospora phragmitis TaxID=2905665 RepID=A0ABR1V3G7_9PEZI